MAAKMERADESDLADIALTLAKAFYDDPVLAIVFGGSVPEKQGSRFFQLVADIQLRHGHIYTTPDRDSAAIWAPPGHWKVPNSEIAKRTPAFIRLFGRRFVANLGILSLLEKNHPNDPHYYLEFLGTAPAAQGKGLGTALMQPMIDRCDEEGAGAYLESSKESNIAFYGRFGFEVTKTLTHKAGPRQWLMWRDPK
jgi:ribosomal protein S18 acetylase RimI-like enzyme